MGFTEVLKPADVKKDFKECCEQFSKSPYFIVDGKPVSTSIWNCPGLVRYVCRNEANVAILENVFENVCTYEKSFSGIAKAFMQIKASESDFKPGDKIRTSSSVLINMVQKNISCEFSKSLLSIIKRYGNPQLSISVQRAPSDKPIVKFVNRPSVKMRIHPKFLVRQNEFKNNKFFMINGAVNTSSEIMKLLNLSFENKNTNYFLVCRSFNDEILFTLKENYDRLLTNVIPLEFGFDVESINSLPDLVSVVGGLPLSPDLGDVISAFDEKRMGYSEKVVIFGENVSVVPSKSSKNHIKKLLSKVDESENEKRELLSKRLINLRGNSCNVFLPRQQRYDDIEINIRHASKIFSDMSRKGITQVAVGNKKFYVPAHSDTIMNSLSEDVENLLKTGVYLPRREKHG